MSQTVTVIGCGSIGFRHARLLRQTPAIQALCDCVLIQDQDAARAAQVSAELGVGWLNAPLHGFTVSDAVLICTWPDSHLALAKQAIEAGVPRVFIEKPLALSLEGVEELTTLAEERKAKVMVACNWRFHPAAQERMPAVVRFRITSRLPMMRSGGPWLDLGSHGYDLARYLGNPDAELDFAYGEQEVRELVYPDHVTTLEPTDAMYVAQLAHFLTADTPMNGLAEATQTLTHLLTTETP